MFPRDCPRGYLEYAEDLAQQIHWIDSDEKLGPSQSFPSLCAHLRRRATNYEELLSNLALYCTECAEAHEGCPLGLAQQEEIVQLGYVTVKMAANELVHRLIQRRQSKEVEAKTQP